MLEHSVGIVSCIISRVSAHVDLVPSHIDLVAAEIELVDKEGQKNKGKDNKKIDLQKLLDQALSNLVLKAFTSISMRSQK